ncbi:unnamed protein product [Cunninghamella blakesleeana]
MQRKSLWGSYTSLPPRTRIWIGVGGMFFATAGMLISDYIEEKRPATIIEKEQLEKMSPITTTRRNNPNLKAYFYFEGWFFDIKNSNGNINIALLLQQVLAVPIVNPNHRQYGTDLTIASKDLLFKREDNGDNGGHSYENYSGEDDDGDNGALVHGQFDTFKWTKENDFAEEEFEFETHRDMILQVTGFDFNGDRFEIFDRDQSLGITSVPNTSHGDYSSDVHCDDPEEALKDDRYSKGGILLPAGCHKITIKIIHSDSCEGKGGIRLIPVYSDENSKGNDWGRDKGDNDYKDGKESDGHKDGDSSDNGHKDGNEWSGNNGDNHVQDSHGGDDYNLGVYRSININGGGKYHHGGDHDENPREIDEKEHDEHEHDGDNEHHENNHSIKYCLSNEADDADEDCNDEYE